MINQKEIVRDCVEEHEWPDFGDDNCFTPGPDESEL